MKLVAPHSLASTLDSIAEALFFGTPIAAADRLEAARLIAGRQGLPGAYAGMFAPTAADASGIRLFTGEPVRSRAGIGHLLSEEACRVLVALQPADAAVQSALERAIAGLVAHLDECERRGYSIGTFCCGTCAGGYWRTVTLDLVPRTEERLRQGMREIAQARIGDGTWRRYPFYHTSLALTEIAPDLAKRELRYAARRWEELLPRLSARSDALSRRRAAVGRRVLERCAN